MAERPLLLEDAVRSTAVGCEGDWQPKSTPAPTIHGRRHVRGSERRRWRPKSSPSAYRSRHSRGRWCSRGYLPVAQESNWLVPSSSQGASGSLAVAHAHVHITASAPPNHTSLLHTLLLCLVPCPPRCLEPCRLLCRPKSRQMPSAPSLYFCTPVRP